MENIYTKRVTTPPKKKQQNHQNLPAPFNHEKIGVQQKIPWNTYHYIYILFFDEQPSNTKKHQDDSTTKTTSRYILRPEALEGAEKKTSLHGGYPYLPSCLEEKDSWIDMDGRLFGNFCK